MTKRIFLIVSFLCVVLIVKGQNQFELEDFSAIKSYGKIELRLVHSYESYLKLSSGSLQEHDLNYKIKNGVLHIKSTKAIPGGKRVNVELGFTDLSSVALGGGVLLYNRDTLKVNQFKIISKSGSEVDAVVDCDSIFCRVNKGAFVRLQGKSRVVLLKTSTGGDYRAVDLKTKLMYARLNGGSAEVNVADYLEATVRMKAKLNYVKLPENIIKKVGLGGSVDVLEKY